MSFALDTALSHWSEIRPQLDQSPRPLEAQRLAHWIKGDVCRVIDQLTCRADFRALARAPIDRLCCGTQTPEGQLIALIDSSLVETAAKLARILEELAAGKEFAEWLSENPIKVPRLVASHISGVITAEGNRTIKSDQTVQEQSRQTPVIVSWLEGLRRIAGRPWDALISVNDYFGSSARLNLTRAEVQRELVGWGSQPPEMAEFSSFLQPNLQDLGDFIFVCFERRVEYWRDKLNYYYNQISSLLHRCPVVTEDQRQAFREAICSVKPLLEELRRLWQESPDAAERLAAIRLVQIRAAFHPERSLDWLIEAVPVVGNAYVFRDRIENRGNRRIAEYVADALSRLSDLYSQDDDIDLQIEDHAKTHPLCVIEGRLRREVFWQGELLNINWHRHERAWILFSTMAEHAKLTGQGVDSSMLEDISLRDAKSDLLRLLPEGLSRLILGTPSTALRLDVPRSEIYYGLFGQYERLECLTMRRGLPALNS